MDIGVFLSDLLLQNNIVNVPGLGIFSLLRESAYYDEKAKVIYPPYYKVALEAESDVNDDTLAKIIAEAKGISLASSQYFVNKYVSQLKQQAVNDEVPVGNIGWFYTTMGALTFKPQTKVTDDLGTFFGYEPVKLNKLNETSVATLNPFYEPVEDEIVTGKNDFTALADTNTEIAAENLADENAANNASQNLDEGAVEQEKTRSPATEIIITVVALALLGLGLFALYNYAPATFEKIKFWKRPVPVAAPVKSKPVIIAAPKTDSLNTDSIKTALTDSAANVADTVDSLRFELIVGNFKTRTGGAKEAKRLVAAGLSDARILENAPGKRFKISVGSFNNEAEAKIQRQKMIKTRQITAKAYILPVVNKLKDNTPSQNK